VSKLGRVIAVALLLAVLGPARPVQPQLPAIELHRTAAARYFESSKQKILFVLIIGSDVREGDPRKGRADSLQLLAVDTRKGTGTMLGIPRDSYVPIPGRGTNKINASLFFGGPERVVQTVSQVSGIPIHYWALIEFSRFRKLVDALGGVEVKVPYAMNDPASGAVFRPGPNKMNGAQALAFSRARKTVPGGDFGRSANQGRLLLAALAKFKRDTGDPFKIATYLRAFRSLVEANVPTNELLDLVAIGRGLDPAKIKSVVVPGRGGTAGGASVVFMTPGDMFKRVKDDAVL
jgi:polyisoprenyl-teichoic acid--peptidoglycan teichoic acid transferase